MYKINIKEFHEDGTWGYRCKYPKVARYELVNEIIVREQLPSNARPGLKSWRAQLIKAVKVAKKRIANGDYQIVEY